MYDNRELQKQWTSLIWFCLADDNALKNQNKNNAVNERYTITIN